MFGAMKEVTTAPWTLISPTASFPAMVAASPVIPLRSVVRLSMLFPASDGFVKAHDYPPLEAIFCPSLTHSARSMSAPSG